MRFLIVASILACAAASPAPLAPYPAAIAPAVPTISAGDINGAAIDAQVFESDHVRAAYDASRQVNDKVNELQGQAVNNAEESAWRAVDNVKTVEARLDGAAASAAPVLSKQLVGRVAYGAPAGAYSAAPAVATYAPALAAPYTAAPYTAVPYTANPYVAAPYAAASYADAPYVAAPYSAYPNVVSPYYGSPLGYQAY